LRILPGCCGGATTVGCSRNNGVVMTRLAGPTQTHANLFTFASQLMVVPWVASGAAALSLTEFVS
jgi:hypothetical protein